MKKNFRRTTLLLLLISAFSAAGAQSKDSVRFPVVIQFQSECCGVPSDVPVRKEIKAFKKKYKVKKITATHIGPMGREGEYWLAFSLKELTKKQSVILSGMLKAITETLKDPGMATYNVNMTVVKKDLSKGTIFSKEDF